ncbi:MAG TPA: hypothetical protein VKW06_08635 [Candidatus Angelobacter sp.]|nr:hypothetical protein [Candidatus Angelobacter sp.]
MKQRLWLWLALFVPGLLPAQVAQETASPNLYHLAGGRLEINYSTTSLNGQPHFTYKDATQTLSFIGGQIRQTKTDIGTLISVTIRMTVDSGSTTFTLLLPSVNLKEPGAPAPVHAVGITTVHRFSVIPAMNRGQTETYTTTELTGTASLVYF